MISVAMGVGTAWAFSLWAVWRWTLREAVKRAEGVRVIHTASRKSAFSDGWAQGFNEGRESMRRKRDEKGHFIKELKFQGPEIDALMKEMSPFSVPPVE